MIYSTLWVCSSCARSIRTRTIHLIFFALIFPITCLLFFPFITWLREKLLFSVVSDWRFDNLCASHLQSQVVMLVSWKFKNPGERFDWSVDRVAVGKCVMWLAVKMASAQVVETSVTNNSPFQDPNQPEDLFQSRFTFYCIYPLGIFTQFSFKCFILFH